MGHEFESRQGICRVVAFFKKTDIFAILFGENILRNHNIGPRMQLLFLRDFFLFFVALFMMRIRIARGYTYFQTKTPNFGTLWKALQYKILISFYRKFCSLFYRKF
jgi:hypothetical protein